MAPHIEDPRKIALPTPAEQILKKMFDAYQRVVIRKEFSGGRSGGYVIEVRPIRLDGTTELPTVVKLAAISLIEKEWLAYKTYIRYKLPNIAEARGKPVLLPEIGWGGLRYTLMGGGTFTVITLAEYMRRPDVSPADVQAVLTRLFRMMHELWGPNQPSLEFQLQSSYDRILPANLLIRHLPGATETKPVRIEPNTLHTVKNLKPGTPVRLEGFAISKVDLIDQTVTLNQRETAANVVRLQSSGVDQLATRTVGDVVNAIEGEVIEGRLNRLNDEIRRALGDDRNPMGDSLTSAGKVELLNPVANLSTLLNKPRHVKVAPVHGDFNLGNILIEPDTGTVSLIDFSEARYDHVLHDCFLLETDVTIKLLPEIIHKHKLSLINVLADLYWRLHATVFLTEPNSAAEPNSAPLLHPDLEKPLAMLTVIRQRARTYLYNFDDYSEYYQGLVIYLLGALRFRNLDSMPEHPVPKQAAFWGGVLTYQFFVAFPEETQHKPPASIERILEAQTTNLTAALGVHEQAYRNRVRERYSQEAEYHVPLSATTTEIVAPPDPKRAPRSSRRRALRTGYFEWVRTQQELRPVKLKSLREAADHYPCIILLGDPGSGKTASLEHLAYQLVGAPDKLPVPLQLNEFSPGLSLEAFIRQAWGGASASSHWQAPELAANLENYLEAGRLFFLFDGLNEMPQQGYQDRVWALRRFIDQWASKGNQFLVTCRALDYGEELTGLQRIEIQPLTDAQIRALLQSELPDSWQVLWHKLAEGEVELATESATTVIDPAVIADDQRHLLKMARNPYLLTIMIDIFTEDGDFGRNKAELMTNFTQILMSWAAKDDAQTGEWLSLEVQREALSALAFEMQRRSGFGTMVNIDQVKTAMPAKVQPDPKWPAVPAPPDQVLTLAARANIIEMPADRSSVRFYHQLLQEYFAARHLLTQAPDSLTDLWRKPQLEERPGVEAQASVHPLPPPPSTGWEETTILAAGFGPVDHLLQALTQVDPILAGRCLYEGQAVVAKQVRQAVIEALLTIVSQPAVTLPVRIAAGEILGHLADPRLGTMVVVPGGSFLMGAASDQPYESPQHERFLPAYQIGQYPVTNADYQDFVESGGYENKRWWTEAGWRYCQATNRREPDYWHSARFNRPNQPVVGVTWYEAVAYCRWLSAKTGGLYRLPTEAEWEKAARGDDGRLYPWGDGLEPSRLNSKSGVRIVMSTTPVGVYPQGVSPFGLHDCAGNVWEWCATKAPGYNFKSYPYDVTEDEWTQKYLEGRDLRVLRGGSWHDNGASARCAYRYHLDPGEWYLNRGFRLVTSA